MTPRTLPPEHYTICPNGMASLYSIPVHHVSISDPRAVYSYGGGMCPEQHWGRLADGRTFYLRMRTCYAELRVGPCGTPEEEMCHTNPLFSWQDFNQACAAGEEYSLKFFAGPVGHVHVCGNNYPDCNDPYRGCFANDEERQRIFTECLDQIERQDAQAIEMGIDPYCDSEESCTCPRSEP